jgi:hypothetical protein
VPRHYPTSLSQTVAIALLASLGKWQQAYIEVLPKSAIGMAFAYRSLLIILVIVTYSCNQQSTGKPVVATNPIYVERDSFVSGDHFTPNEREYFLVNTNGNDNAVVLAAIDTFVRYHAPAHYSKFFNYIISFYRESKDVNEEEFNKSVPPKYNFFLDNDDAQIVYYQYADARLMDRTIK